MISFLVIVNPGRSPRDLEGKRVGTASRDTRNATRAAGTTVAIFVVRGAD